MFFEKRLIDIFLKPISDLEFTRRTETALTVANINFTAELLSMTEFELLKIPNIGRKSLNEIREVVESHECTLGMLRGYSADFATAPNIEKFFNELNVARNAEPVDPLKAWMLGHLPKTLRDGLKPEFLNAVLDDPTVHQVVQNAIETISIAVHTAVLQKLKLPNFAGGPPQA